MLGFKHFKEEAHKAKDDPNKQKLAEKSHVFRVIDFGRILGVFRKGVGNLRFSCFLSMFFRCRLSSVIGKAKKSAKMSRQDTESENFGLGSDDPQAPGERKG